MWKRRLEEVLGAARFLSMDIPQWELKKENVLPIKSGRSTTALNNTLLHTQDPWDAKLPPEKMSRDALLLQQQRAFEDRLGNGDAKDPLKPWLRYIKWAQRTFPSGGRLPNGESGVLELIERCTRTFRHAPSYRNDERYIKVWIRYADLLTNPSDVFKFMRANHIGDNVALYYIATAWAAEKRGNIKLADVAYQKGIARGAEPAAMLLQRQREFLRRLGRKMIRGGGGGGALSRGQCGLNCLEHREPFCSNVAKGQLSQEMGVNEQTKRPKRCPLGHLTSTTLSRATVAASRNGCEPVANLSATRSNVLFAVLNDGPVDCIAVHGHTSRRDGVTSSTNGIKTTSSPNDGNNRGVVWDSLHSSRVSKKENAAAPKKWSGAQFVEKTCTIP